MLMFLWFAGQEACSYREMGKMFDVCLSSVHEVIFQVSSFLSGLAASYIVWPDNERKKKCEEYFLHHKGFPGVIGCIGRTHVLIDPPKNNKEDFVDRKGNFSISLQLVCNHEKKFTDVFIGQTGPTDEASIYLASPLCADLHQRVGQGQYLVGDYVYPCETCLLTPYENTGQLTDEQQNFNWKLNSCRIFIEEAKADLKRRFRQLYYCKLKGLPNLCHFVRACVVLHNMSEPDDLKYLEPAHAEEDLTDSTVCEALTERRGNNLRDEVCHLLCKQ
ncbi:hypothetical protein AAG570_002521 [Ranatra chinensis]|uniref:DDE Tnp4 domain-containing protein n=1 Tax=Ranatra chinensis TaxID=642074 RepID=A0ABD0Y869_9HEMI